MTASDKLLFCSKLYAMTTADKIKWEFDDYSHSDIYWVDINKLELRLIGYQCVSIYQQNHKSPQLIVGGMVHGISVENEYVTRLFRYLNDKRLKKQEEYDNTVKRKIEENIKSFIND